MAPPAEIRHHWLSVGQALSRRTRHSETRPPPWKRSVAVSHGRVSVVWDGGAKRQGSRHCTATGT
jgi:hypothetical protein